MNYFLICRYLGIVSLIIGGAMLLSLPWAFPLFGGQPHVEVAALRAFAISIGIAVLAGLALVSLGRRAGETNLFRKEAIAVVGLSWILTSVLGAFPFLLSDTCSGRLASSSAPVPMTLVDTLFESASGFSGTGATVITDLEDPTLVPRSVLFWRSETHFLGGLGIMVLFVALLGHGSSGKAVMRLETSGSWRAASHTRMQHAAWNFTSIYLGLNAILTALLLAEGMSLFDALCHSFGTIATGGFSTYNDSVAHFHSPLIEMTLTLFMAIACINFAVLYAVLLLRPGRLIRDVEVLTYLAILLGSTALVVIFGLGHRDFASLPEAVRYSVFQVTSILTNTGFGSTDFDRWNQFARGLLFLLMFVGGCAGSTSCSIKVIRYVILFKVLRRELQRASRPHVVRLVMIDGEPVEDAVVQQVLFYFGLVIAVFVVSWLLLVLFEPDATWTSGGQTAQEKLIDCASGVGATLNGVGPGLGTIGATKNYGHFQPSSKLLLTLLMLWGRIEIIPILVLFTPWFWRTP